jgi:hypothetical protein
VGGGEYARFWKYKSPVLMGVLAVLGGCGGLTGSCADGEGFRVAVAWAGVVGGEEGRLVAPPAAALRPSAER